MFFVFPQVNNVVWVSSLPKGTTTSFLFFGAPVAPGNHPVVIACFQQPPSLPRDCVLTPRACPPPRIARTFTSNLQCHGPLRPGYLWISMDIYGCQQSVVYPRSQSFKSIVRNPVWIVESEESKVLLSNPFHLCLQRTRVTPQQTRSPSMQPARTCGGGILDSPI